MVRDTKLYDMFEVNSDASTSQIKKSYNRLSKLWHPDRHTDNEKKKEATIKFQEINQAKDILLDDEKRRVYDEIGMDIFTHNPDNNNNNSGQDPFTHFGNVFPGGFPFNMGGMPGFHGMHGMHGMPGNVASKKIIVEDIVEFVEGTLEQIINKVSVPLNYTQKVSCVKCNEEGTKDLSVPICKNCNGKGVDIKIIRMGPMIQQIMSTCSICEGKGSVVDETNKCDDCNGQGYITRNKTIQVPLLPNVLFGQNAIFQGKGHQLKNQKTNLIVKIKELPHNVFTRYNDDLYIEMELKLYQTLFGFNKIINHLDGRKLHISCSGKTDFNMIRKINNEGIINPQGKKGDLYIKFIHCLPNFNNLPSDTKNQLKGLLQSFDKTEVLNETNINKATDTTKTICVDLRQDQTNKILYLLDNIKYNKSNQHNNQQTNVSESNGNSENNGPQCVHQ